jgi:hypothetical protein
VVVLDGVGDEVEQHLLEALAVGADVEAGVAVPLQADGALGGERAGEVEHLGHDEIDGDRLEREGEPARLDAGDVQHLVDQAEQVAAAAEDLPGPGTLSLGGPRIHRQDLGEAEDGVEGRAQLVGHAGEELALRLVRALQLAVLLLDLAEEARILDRDHGLIGEGLDQRDLLRCEWARLGFIMIVTEEEGANRRPFAHQRHGEHRPHPGPAKACLRELIHARGVDLDIGEMDRAPFSDRLRVDTALGQRAQLTRELVRPFGARAIPSGACPQHVALDPPDAAMAGATEPRRPLRHRRQHGVNVGGRAADDVQHLGRRRLLLQRLIQIAVTGR